MVQTRVLVVDDDEGILEFLTMALEGEGYSVLTAVNGAALQLAHDHQPAVVLLDLMMPGMDGIEVSQRLRADPATAHIPIIAMSAQDRLQAAEPSMSADDRLPKPFDLNRLFATVARWATSP